MLVLKYFLDVADFKLDVPYIHLLLTLLTRFVLKLTTVFGNMTYMIISPLNISSSGMCSFVCSQDFSLMLLLFEHNFC